MSYFFIYLRRPRGNDPRNDPFWEFGSFGTTGCHRHNLLHLQSSPIRTGDRLVFLQGGKHEIRAVALTPPVKDIRQVRVQGKLHIELCWRATYKPLKYPSAPVLINNDGETEFPSVLEMLRGVARPTWCGKAGSKLRTNKQPLSESLASELEQWFKLGGKKLTRASNYIDAVEAPGGVWHQHASTNKWAAKEQRTARYLERMAGSVQDLSCGKRGCT